jgi:hypothetical protein
MRRGLDKTNAQGAGDVGKQRAHAVNHDDIGGLVVFNVHTPADVVALDLAENDPAISASDAAGDSIHLRGQASPEQVGVRRHRGATHDFFKTVVHCGFLSGGWFIVGLEGGHALLAALAASPDAKLLRACRLNRRATTLPFSGFRFEGAGFRGRVR